MPQTELYAFRQCLKYYLGGTASVNYLPGGFYMNRAPSQDPRTRQPLQTPYAVATILTAPTSIANAAARVFTSPLVRVMVYGRGGGDETVAAVDLAYRWIDSTLEALRYTANGPAGAADEPVEIRGFYRETAYADLPPDRDGQDYTRVGGDYRGIGYYLGQCSPTKP